MVAPAGSRGHGGTTFLITMHLAQFQYFLSGCLLTISRLKNAVSGLLQVMATVL